MSNNNDFIDLTNLDEIRTGTHIIIDYISCTFPFLIHAEDYELYVIEDIVNMITDFLGYTKEDVVKEEYAQNRFKHQYTIAGCITLRLIGPELKSGYHSCSIELKGEGCREWENHNKDKTWKDFIEFCLIRLNGTPTRIDLTIDDYEGKDVNLEYIRYKMDNDYYTTSFRGKKYIIHGNEELGFTLQLGSHESTQELCIYEKNKEQKKKKGYCRQPYWLRFEMRFRREKAYDVCMNLVNCEVDKYSEFFYSLLYDMLDLKEDNDYDNNNQYKIETDHQWKAFLNDVSKCKLKRFKIKKKSKLENYREWAEPIVGKYIQYICLINRNDIDKTIIDLLKLTQKQSFNSRDFERINEYLKSLCAKPITGNETNDLELLIEKRIQSFRDLPF